MIYWVKWRGVAYGTDARQPYANLKHTAADAFKELAYKNNLPGNIFEKGSNRMPVSDAHADKPS